MRIASAILGFFHIIDGFFGAMMQAGQAAFASMQEGWCFTFLYHDILRWANITANFA